MARPKKTSGKNAEAPLIPTTSLVASAVRYPGKVPRVHYQTSGQDWQKECYRHFAICGEARFAASFFGHALSRCKLEAVRENEKGEVSVVRDGEVHELLQELFNGPEGQSQMLAAAAIHLTIAGEFYLIGRTVMRKDDDGNVMVDNKGKKIGDDVWEIVSVLELNTTGSTWAIKNEGFADIPLADDDIVIRIWRPNPANRMVADSPFRSLLPILTEIEWLTRYIFAQTSSRLAGAGILFLPSGMTFPSPPSREGEPQPVNEADSFMLALGEHMLKPLEDPSDPASKIPIIVTAPDASIDKARLMTFWTELDSEAKELRNEAIQRFAVGMDLPPEQVLGMSSNNGTGGGTSNGVSHWGAWQIEEATIKMHVEPMLDLLVNSITVSYIRPLAPDSKDRIRHDSSALRLRPDRSKEAIELWQSGAIGLDTMLVENGFDPTKDAPDERELKDYFLRKIASGSATPEQVEAALSFFGVELDSGRFGKEPDDETPRKTPDAPSLDDHPRRERTPGEDDPAYVEPAFLASAEGLVLRALEKAGNRVISEGARRGKERDRTISPLAVHCEHRINGRAPTLLDGAFTTASIVLPDDGHREEVVRELTAFCCGLYDRQEPYSRAALAEHLAAAGLGG